MKRRALSVLAALLVAISGAVAVVAYAQAADSRAVAGQATRSVFIARAEVPVGTTAAAALAERLILEESVVAKGVPDGALQTVVDLTGSLVATTAILPGEIVLAARFGKKAALSAVQAVPEGKVAVTVALSDPQRIAPLLSPGAHILLFDTYNARDPKATRATPDGRHLTDDEASVRVTRVLLEDVMVIAVGDATTLSHETAAKDEDEEKKASPDAAGMSALVTVAVTPGEAVRLVHAIQTGTLYGALRGDNVEIPPAASASDHTVLDK